MLVTWASDIKVDEDGEIAPASRGIEAEEVIFVDDEKERNLEAVVCCLALNVAGRLLEECGMRAQSKAQLQAIQRKAEALVLEGFEAQGACVTQDDSFWVEFISNLSAKILSRPQAENVAAVMRARNDWLPERLKVFDVLQLSSQQSLNDLSRVPARNQALRIGSKTGILFLDIDGTLLNVNSHFYLYMRADPSKPVYMVNQEQFADHPTFEFWR